MKATHILSIVYLSYAVAVTATARDVGQNEALDLRQKGEIMPFEDVFKKATQRYPEARLLEVELEEDDDIYIYEIELITRAGVVRELELDARTGRILADEEDD